MNRKNFFITLALVIVATAVAFVSCKKDPAPAVLEQGNPTLARIRDFKRQLDAVGLSPDEKNVTYMSVADAVWNIEALFNYTYAFPDESYGQTVCCDTTLYLPVYPNDSVSLSDLYVFNGQMYEAVLALYNAAVLNNKQFVILDVEAGECDGNLQAIELQTVQGSLKGEQPVPGPPQAWVPFGEEGLWFYGGDVINSFGEPVDAADTLTSVLNAMLVPQAPENHEYVYTNVISKKTEIGEHYQNPTTGYDSVSPRYCEFYKENPTPQDHWLNSDQMNYYYFGERHLVKSILPNREDYLVPSDFKVFLILVEENATSTTIEHHTTAFYGWQFMVALDSIHKEDLR